MGFIEVSLAALGFTGDALAVGQFVAEKLRSDQSCTGSQLFAKCFALAVARYRPRLLHLCRDCSAEDISADRDALEKAIRVVEEQFGTIAGEIKVESLVPLFANCVVLPGHQLDRDGLMRELLPIVENAIKDFFTRLPATPKAFREVDLRHRMTTATNAADQADQRARQQAEILAIVQRIEVRQDQLRESEDYLDPTVLQQESSRPEHRNPFRIVKAEDFDHDYARLAMLFREPSDYELIRGPDNLIIAGGRGCGKSMILRSLSLQASLEIARLRWAREHKSEAPARLTYAEAGLNYIGVYIKLARGYFYEWSPDCKLSEGAATALFQHVFNLLLLKSLIETLVSGRDAGAISIAPQQEHAVVEKIREVGAFRFSGRSFGDLVGELQSQEHRVAQYLFQLRLGQTPAPYAGGTTYIHNFITDCCAGILAMIPGLDKSRVFFLLDEYENLATFQQTVVNTLAKLRPFSLTLKIATRHLGVKSRVDLQKEPIQVPRDYQVVELDYDIEDAKYRELLLDIAAKRLTAEGFAVTDIRELLEKAPPYHPADEASVEVAIEKLLTQKGKSRSDLSEGQWKELLHQWDKAMVYRIAADGSRRHPYTFAGFDDLVHLSSGIISTFLELCKITFYQADGEGVAVRTGGHIPWKTQDEAVYATSKAYLDWIPRNIENTGPTISRLVLDLGDIFREKLLHHTSEPEAARIAIRDPEKLDLPEHASLAGVLADAVRWSVLHPHGAGGSYFPKHKSDVRANEFHFNRILVPILRISPRPRWPTAFSVDELGRLIEVRSRNDVRNALRAKHGSDGCEGLFGEERSP